MFDVSAEAAPGSGATPGNDAAVPRGAIAVAAPFVASVWQIDVRAGVRVAKGDKLLSLEAMKMETVLTSPHDGTVVGIYTGAGSQVEAGQSLLAIEPAPGSAHADEAAPS